MMPTFAYFPRHRVFRREQGQMGLWPTKMGDRSPHHPYRGFASDPRSRGAPTLRGEFWTETCWTHELLDLLQHIDGSFVTDSRILRCTRKIARPLAPNFVKYPPFKVRLSINQVDQYSLNKSPTAAPPSRSSIFPYCVLEAFSFFYKRTIPSMVPVAALCVPSRGVSPNPPRRDAACLV